MNELERVAQICTILDQLRVSIQADGGDITFVRVEDTIVYVKLHGACIHCPVSFFTLKVGIEQTLQAAGLGIKRVEVCSE